MKGSEIPLSEFLDELRKAQLANDHKKIHDLMNEFVFTDECAKRKIPSLEEDR